MSNYDYIIYIYILSRHGADYHIIIFMIFSRALLIQSGKPDIFWGTGDWTNFRVTGLMARSLWDVWENGGLMAFKWDKSLQYG